MGLRNFNDQWDSDVSWQLVESEEKNPAILGSVEGAFFFPNGKSRNGRWYDKEVWEKVLANPIIQERLNNRVMFGFIGHPEKLRVDDKDLEEGKPSHIITSLKIEESDDGHRGVGKADILNTDTGRRLFTYFKANASLNPSSRAAGDYKGQKEGVPKVDPDKFNFETFDFVLRPGFEHANAGLIESLEGDEEVIMDKFLEKVMEEKDKMEKRLETLITTNSELKVKNEGLETANTTLTTENEKLKNDVSELEGVKEILTKYQEIGEVEEIKTSMKELKKKIDEYKEAVGEVGDANDLIEKVSEFEEFGTPEELKKKLEKFEELIEEIEPLGDIDDIKDALEASKQLAEKLSEIGSIDEITELFDEISKLVEYLEGSKKKEEKETKKKTESLAEELAEEFGTELEEVKQLLTEGTEDEVREALTEKEDKKKKEDFTEDNKDGESVEGSRLVESILT